MSPARPTARRRCPICTSSFVANPRQPSHTYCSTRCRRAAYDRRTRGAAPGNRDAVPDGVPDAVENGQTALEQGKRQPPRLRPGDSRDAVGAVGDGVADGETRELGHCPHCHQPIALVTLLLTPNAAHVSVPEPPPTHQDRS